MRNRVGLIGVGLASLAGALALAAAPAHAQPQSQSQSQRPLVDALATKLVQKYQSSSCQQLAEERRAPKSQQREEAKERAGEILRRDAPARQEFVRKVAAPIVDKMIVCGFLP